MMMMSYSGVTAYNAGFDQTKDLSDLRVGVYWEYIADAEPVIVKVFTCAQPPYRSQFAYRDESIAASERGEHDREAESSWCQHREHHHP